MQFDQHSVFRYGPGSVLRPTDFVNLTRLTQAISIHFRAFCRLSKSGDGTMHKVAPCLLSSIFFIFVQELMSFSAGIRYSPTGPADIVYVCCSRSTPCYL